MRMKLSWVSCLMTLTVAGFKEKMMKEILLVLWNRFLDIEVYMSFHWIVLIGLWVICGYQLWNHEFGNVLCTSAMIAVWKMKGVEE